MQGTELLILFATFLVHHVISLTLDPAPQGPILPIKLKNAICSDTYTRTAGQRITADQTNTCVYYLLSNVNGKCIHTKLRCPPGKKVSENFYFMPASAHPCNYDIDPKLEKPCQRRNHPNDLIYQMVPWECYGDTTCCFHEIGQAAEDC